MVRMEPRMLNGCLGTRMACRLLKDVIGASFVEWNEFEVSIRPMLCCWCWIPPDCPDQDPNSISNSIVIELRKLGFSMVR